MTIYAAHLCVTSGYKHHPRPITTHQVAHSPPTSFRRYGQDCPTSNQSKAQKNCQNGKHGDQRHGFDARLARGSIADRFNDPSVLWSKTWRTSWTRDEVKVGSACHVMHWPRLSIKTCTCLWRANYYNLGIMIMGAMSTQDSLRCCRGRTTHSYCWRRISGGFAELSRPILKHLLELLLLL